MRDSNGRYVKGHKSQGGRPAGSKGIATYIKEQTNGLKELVDLSLELLRADGTVTRDKISLINILMDRAVGKPQQIIDATVHTELDDMLEELEHESDGETTIASEEVEE